MLLPRDMEMIDDCLCDDGVDTTEEEAAADALTATSPSLAEAATSPSAVGCSTVRRGLRLLPPIRERPGHARVRAHELPPRGQL